MGLIQARDACSHESKVIQCRLCINLAFKEKNWNIAAEH